MKSAIIICTLLTGIVYLHDWLQPSAAQEGYQHAMMVVYYQGMK